MQVNRGRFEVDVPEKRLHGRQVSSPFHKMCGETVTEDLPILLMIRIQQRSAIGFIRSME